MATLLQGLAGLFKPTPQPSTAPVATADTVSGISNIAVTGNVLTNDTDPLGHTLTAALVAGPKNGTLQLNTNGSFTYTPKTGYIGADSFTYTAVDGSQKSAVTTVTVNIAAPPVTKPVIGTQGIAPWIGLSPTQIQEALAAAKAAGSSSIRIDVSWYQVEWVKGTYDWSALDQEVKAIRDAGMTPLAVIYDTPPWLSGNPNPHTPPANSTQIQQFGKFAGAVAVHFNGQIRDFEIWNEQNIPRFWATPNAAAYTAVLKSAYTAIKAVNAANMVITGGLSPDTSGIDPTAFIRGIYAAGGKGYFDAIGYHQYNFTGLPTIDPVQAIHNVMVTNGDGNKKIWLTEAGAATGTGSYAVSDQMQADTILALLEEAAQYSYIGPVYFYTIMDTGSNLSDPEQNFGLIHQDGTPKLAYEVLQQFMTGGSASSAAVSA